MGENLGFAEGSNAGLRRARGEAVLFLNNDIRLGRRGWLEEIRQAVEPGVLVGPLRGDFHSQVDGHPMPYIDGWCLAGMTDDLLALGGFDADLEEPAYYSDNLLCLEARAAGMTLRDLRVGLDPQAERHRRQGLAALGAVGGDGEQGSLHGSRPRAAGSGLKPTTRKGAWHGQADCQVLEGRRQLGQPE